MIDYGVIWHHKPEFLLQEQANIKGNIYYELKYFYDKDPETKQFLKAGLTHYILDFFQETREDISDIDKVFEKCLMKKLFPEITIGEGQKININSEIEEVFNLLRENSKELILDLKGFYSQIA